MPINGNPTPSKPTPRLTGHLLAAAVRWCKDNPDQAVALHRAVLADPQAPLPPIEAGHFLDAAVEALQRVLQQATIRETLEFEDDDL